MVEASDRSLAAMFLFCFFLGTFGAHRFYAGKILTGLLMFITIGGFGIWWLIDMIVIIFGAFRDADGLPIRK